MPVSGGGRAGSEDAVRLPLRQSCVKLLMVGFFEFARVGIPHEKTRGDVMDDLNLFGYFGAGNWQ